MAENRWERAIEHALTEGGWRADDLEAVIRGPARDAKGCPIACCSRCGRPEWEDGLIATELVDDGGYDGTPIVSDFVCPPCKVREAAEPEEKL